MKDEELFKLLVDKKIGTGVYRTVYSLKFSDTKVIKVANDEQGEVENAREAVLWEDLKQYYPKISKWFAQVYMYSNTGKYLIQEKVIFPDKKKYPKKLPSFFSDTKYSNFGLLNGRWVCVDFGCFNIRHSDRLKKVNWWE